MALIQELFVANQADIVQGNIALCEYLCDCMLASDILNLATAKFILRSE